MNQNQPLSTNKYPTKKEILTHNQLHTKEHSKIVTTWKKDHYTSKWKTLTNHEKLLALAWLAVSLAKGVKIKKDKMWATELGGPSSPQIFMDEFNPSIISMLHEIGHVLFGESELTACVFSVKLFTEIFPTEYSHLTWHGHMLKRNAKT